MESSDDDISKSSDDNSPFINQSSQLFTREEDRPGRVLLRPWLENMLESGNIEGLQWLDKEKTMFKVPWKHRSKKDWSSRHSSVFLEWAKNTGRWTKGDPTPNYAQLKTRLRCAFNKAPDIEEMKGFHSAQGEEPYKVYRFKNRKECLANKLNNQNNKGLSKRFFNTPSSRVNPNSGQWEIKKERYDEKIMIGSDGYYSDKSHEPHVLLLQDHDGELKEGLKGEPGDTLDNDKDDVDSKFVPNSVIPLSVELISSWVSDESDAENDGSRRSKVHKGRQGSSKSHKQQETPSTDPLKQQQPHNDYTANNNNNISIHSVKGEMDCEERGNLDFLRVASLFVEAGKILQKGKEPESESETKPNIKQEIPEPDNSDDETDPPLVESVSLSDSSESGKIEKNVRVVRTLESIATSNSRPQTVPQMSLGTTGRGYPPRLPKLVPLSSLRNINLLNSDYKPGTNSTLLSQLSKIRMANASILNQGGISKPQIRFSPSSGASALPQTLTNVVLPRSDSISHFQPRLLIFSSSSYHSNFSPPVVSMPRSINPGSESVRIVLGKFQSPKNNVVVGSSVFKDSGISCQSMPSLIMLSSAAESIEQSPVARPATPRATFSLSTTVVSSNKNIGADVVSTISGNNNNMTSSTTIVTSIIKPVTSTCVTPVLVSGSGIDSSADKEKLSVFAQEEALDLSSGTPKPKDVESLTPHDLGNKLEVVDRTTHLNPINPKDDVIMKSDPPNDDDVDVATKLNELGIGLKEIEESSNTDPKVLKSMKNFIETIRTCMAELNQKEKSLNSQKDVLHWRTKLLQSEEEKFQMKAQYLGISLKKEILLELPRTDVENSEATNRPCSSAEVQMFTEKLKSTTNIPTVPVVVNSINYSINSINIQNEKVLDLVKLQSSLVVNNKLSNPLLSHKTLSGLSSVVKTTVAPSTISTVLPLTIAGASKSPKPIRLINLGKTLEPTGVVYPMQQDRGKVQLARPPTPALSIVNGTKVSLGSPRSAVSDSFSISPSRSPSSSPLVINLQNPLSQMKIVKINRTPSTEANPSSISQGPTRSTPGIPPVREVKSKSPETNEIRNGDDLNKESNLEEVGKSKKRHRDESQDSASKIFKSMGEEDASESICNKDLTATGYDHFKSKWYPKQ